MRAPALVAAALCLALTACGSGTAEDAENAVREFAQAVTDSDSEKLCDSFTRDAREKVTGATGDNAFDQCKELFDASRGQEIEIQRIVKTQLDGDHATVTVELKGQGGARPQVFELEHEDGRFRISSAG